MTKPDLPRVFLSYSHESDAHKHWVRGLAEDLTKNGVKTTLDQWHLQVGDDIGAFMEQAVKNATYIVLVCTEAFAQKANDRKGGVGYEQAMLVGELLMSRELGSRFLPILRSGDPSKALPLYMSSRLFVDCRDDSTYEQALDQLLRRIFGAPAFTPPQLGETPKFVIDGGHAEARPESSTPRTVVADTPKGWVLVAGTGASPMRKLGEKVEQTSSTLGLSLARFGYGLVTGGWPGVDELTSRSFARELELNGIPLEDRLIQVVVEDKLPAFPAGNLVLVHHGEEEWTESVKRAEAVVLIGGIGGTLTTGEYGLKFGRAVFPLADTGGDAAKFYMQMQRNWKPEFLPGIDKSKFQVVAREAPRVISGLIKLLDEWKSLQTGPKDSKRRTKPLSAFKGAARQQVLVNVANEIASIIKSDPKIAPSDSPVPPVRPGAISANAPDTNIGGARATIRFETALLVDPVSVKRVLTASPAHADYFDIEWPRESDTLLASIRSLYADAERYTESTSLFYGVASGSVRNFMDWSERYKSVPVHRQQVELRMAYLLETLNRSEVLAPWKEDILTKFLRLANYLIHVELAQCWFLHRGLPPQVPERLPAAWRALMLRGDTPEAHLPDVMDWEPPIFRQNVMELSGRRMNRYFYVPRAYCKDAFSVTEYGFMDCIVPQYEYSLALENSQDSVRYNGVLKSSKTVNQESRDVYPPDWEPW